jgi:hypothetical protein
MLIIRNIPPRIKVVASMILLSELLMLWVIHNPVPGHSKITSTRMQLE